MTEPPRAGDFTPVGGWSGAAVFDLLAALFATPPSAEAVGACRRGPAAALLSALAAEPGCADAVGALRDALGGSGEDAVVAAQLGRAFCLLFEGVGGRNAASPYESAYRGDGRLFQAPVAEMQALLAAHDLIVAASAGEPPDHVAIELALTARLLAEFDPDAAAMIERLAGWTPDFAAAVAAAGVSHFWTGAARVLAAVVARERGGHDEARERVKL